MFRFLLLIKGQVIVITINIPTMIEEEEDEMPNMQKSVKNIADSMSIVSGIIEKNDEKGFNDWLSAGDAYITTEKGIRSHYDWLKNVLIPFLIRNEHYKWIKFVQLKIGIQPKMD